jgi:outer membrane protein assembly factor BamB
VQVSGSGFYSYETVNISLLGTVLGPVTATSNGSLPATDVTIPATTGFGLTALVATGPYGAAAAAGIDITNSWTQLGGGPGHTGFEANDPLITDTISPGQNIVLDPAWQFNAGAALTPAAVVDQTVYAGDSKGTLFALAARDGARLWTWHTPNGAAIVNSPAVDAAAGLVFVGTSRGDLYAVTMSGPSAGTLAWSHSLGGGSIQSLVFGGAEVYAASSNGTVEALAETTGALAWSAAIAGISRAPALDPAGGVLVVAASGGVTALSTATGTSLWHFPVPGPTSPMLAAGTVYVGSSNGSMYAVSESTGQQIWSHAMGGAIEADALSESSTGSVTEIFLASADHSLYFLNPATGAVIKQMRLGERATGMAVAGNMVFNSTTGLMKGARTFGQWEFWYNPEDGQLRPPAVVNGTLFLTGQSGALWAFTPYGQPPQ